MNGLRLAIKKGSDWMFGDTGSLPERDDRMIIVDSLLAELDHHIRELNRIFAERDREERRLQTGVDYSWLMASPPKAYQIPQLERLELEELCLKLEVSECTRVISLFRDSILREPHVEDLVRIMRSCVIQILEQRPRQKHSRSLSEWVTSRASSIASLKKHPSRVEPSADSSDDIEMQAEDTRRVSVPSFLVSGVSIPSGDAILMTEREGTSHEYCA